MVEGQAGGALIRNVSDTARWVAAYRARETRRTDALFRDPLATRLAGEHGERIADAMSSRSDTTWAIVARTVIIDDYVAACLAQGCDCVLNLAAGLDTRPYRLNLPQSLLWIEADLPEILDYKEAQLKDQVANCRLERRRVDLSDASQRAALFKDVSTSARRVLVISEGLVIYLERDIVAELGRHLLATPSFQWWVLDASSEAVLARLRRWSDVLANAPFKFAANGVGFFEGLGWNVADVRSLLHEAARMRRVPWFMRIFAFFPRPDDRAPGKQPWSGVIRLVRP